MQESENPEFADNEELSISFLNLMNFLKKTWKTVIVFIFLGIAIALTYIFLAPNQYEATAQIRLAQINFSLSSAPLGTPVEDQASLLARLQFPGNFGKSTIQACGYEDRPQPSQALAKNLKFSIAKGMVNIIELHLLAPSIEKASECVKAVVTQVGLLQQEMISPYVDDAKAELLIDNERLDSARRIIAKADQSGNAFSAISLAARDEMTFFLAEREKKLALIRSAEQRNTKLASPIFIGQKPVSPKKVICLLAGMLGGLFLGLANAICRQLIVRLKGQL